MGARDPLFDTATTFAGDRTGLSSVSAKLNNWFASLPAGSYAEIPAGAYRLTDTVGWSGKALTLVPRGDVKFIQDFPTGVAGDLSSFKQMMHCTSASGSTIADGEGRLTFVGNDDAALYDAVFDEIDNRNQTACALSFADSDDVHIGRVKVSAKISGVVLLTCTNSTIDRMVMSGFGQAALALRAANYLIGINFVQGENNTAINPRITGHGNAVSCAGYRQDVASNGLPVNTKIIDPILIDSYDNCIYGSSMDGLTVVNPFVKGVNSSSIKAQGDGLEVIGGTIEGGGLTGGGATGGAITISGQAAAQYDSRFGSRNHRVIGTTFKDNAGRHILLQPRPGSTFHPKNIEIANVEMYGGGIGISGCAEYIRVRGAYMESVGGHGIYLLAAGASTSMYGIDIRDLTVKDGGNMAFLVNGAMGMKARDVEAINTASGSQFCQIQNTNDSDFHDFKTDYGRLAEIAGCDNNLFSNIPVVSVAAFYSGTNHRQPVAAVS